MTNEERDEWLRKLPHGQRMAWLKALHGDDFTDNLRCGYRWQLYVAECMRAEGLTVDVPSLGDIPPWFKGNPGDEGDLLVKRGDRKIRIEVKSRNLKFSNGGADYPFDEVIVNTLADWKKKVPLPRAVVFVSQLTHALAAVSCRDRTLWGVRVYYQASRKQHQECVVCPRSQLQPFMNLVNALRS